MKTLPLTQGRFAIIDDEDFEFLSQWKWYFNGGYAVRGSSPKILMHRVINGTPDGLDTDHINGKCLDNRKGNLRSASRAQNAVNREKQSNNTSGYKCVSWHRPSKRWVAYFVKDKKTKFIGSFDCPVKAAVAYNKKAIEVFGEFAKLNRIEHICA